jgi:hypothetical protein
MPESADRDARPTPSATLAAVQAELAAWRAAHPQATFAELEAAVEAGVAQLRASLVREAVPRDPGARAAARPQCAGCAVPLTARGRHRRTVQLWGDHPVELERTYWSCPRCRAGHFPPG